MIIKVTLTLADHARLSEFVASIENTTAHLKELFGEHASFAGSEHWNSFCSILQCTRHNGKLLEEEKLNVTLKVSEYYRDLARDHQALFPVPAWYAEKLLRSMATFAFKTN